MSASGTDGTDQGPSQNLSGQVDLERLSDVIASDTEVAKVIRLNAIVDDGELIVTAKVALAADKSLSEVAEDIETIKARIRAEAPAAQQICIEPDIYRPAIDPQPPTDFFVWRSTD